MHRDGREREKDRESRECFIALMLDVVFDHPLQGIKNNSTGSVHSLPSPGC